MLLILYLAVENNASHIELFNYLLMRIILELLMQMTIAAKSTLHFLYTS